MFAVTPTVAPAGAATMMFEMPFLEALQTAPRHAEMRAAEVGASAVGVRVNVVALFAAINLTA